MKLVLAIIEPEDVENVQAAVEEAGGSAMSISEIRYLQGQGTEYYRGAEYKTTRCRLKIEIVVINDSCVADVIEAISNAITGLDRSMSKGSDILVLDVNDAVRVHPRETSARVDSRLRRRRS
jgi:nitrogen regulatory protein PII